MFSLHFFSICNSYFPFGFDGGDLGSDRPSFLLLLCPLPIDISDTAERTQKDVYTTGCFINCVPLSTILSFSKKY